MGGNNTSDCDSDSENLPYPCGAIKKGTCYCTEADFSCVCTLRISLSEGFFFTLLHIFENKFIYFCNPYIFKIVNTKDCVH